ncbi:MAG: DUF192 domain-containing protein [Eubacteriaceae bacterium]|nr:DUF192 domain-containing protein [Eubacteriaceae bacterium]
MKSCKVVKDELVLVDHVRIADHFFEKLVGLLKDKVLESQQGLLLKGCKQVHTIGMKFPIDVIFLSKGGVILHLENNMLPRQMSKYIRSAFWCLELKSGAVQEHHLKLNDLIEFEMN